MAVHQVESDSSEKKGRARVLSRERKEIKKDLSARIIKHFS